MQLAEIFKNAGKEPINTELINELQRNLLIGECLIGFLGTLSNIHECADNYAELFRQEQRRKEYQLETADFNAIHSSPVSYLYGPPTLAELEQDKRECAARIAELNGMKRDIDRIIGSMKNDN